MSFIAGVGCRLVLSVFPFFILFFINENIASRMKPLLTALSEGENVTGR